TGPMCRPGWPPWCVLAAPPAHWPSGPFRGRWAAPARCRWRPMRPNPAAGWTSRPSWPSPTARACCGPMPRGLRRRPRPWGRKWRRPCSSRGPTRFLRACWPRPTHTEGDGRMPPALPLAVLTRPRGRNESIARALEAEGLAAIIAPALVLRPLGEPAPAPAGYDLAVFVSRQAVEQYFAQHAGPWPATTVAAAVGQATARA